MVERLRHLVVLVPGIGGSVLTTAERPVWDGGPGRTAASLLHPRRLDVTEHPDLVSVGLVPKIGFAGPLALPGYTGLLAAQHRVPSAEIRDAVEDPLAAADLAIRLIGEGDPAALSPLALAAPRLAGGPLHRFLRRGRQARHRARGPGDARALMAVAASQGDLVQRTAGAVRLHLLSRRLPGSAAELNHLADLLTLVR